MSQFYKQIRGEGLTHDEAIERVCATYSYPNQQSDVEGWLAEARREVENPAAPEPEPEPVAEAEPDPLDELEQDARARVAELEQQRARLSLDATIGDEPAKREAADELRSVESELASARAELQRLPLARAERDRRAAQAAEEAQRVVCEKAGTKIGPLQKRVSAAAASVDEAARRLAEAIRTHAQLDEQLTETRETATGEAGPIFRPRPAYSSPVRHALHASGVGWALAFDATVSGPAAPLATTPEEV
jgi:hypothetical protein